MKVRRAPKGPPLPKGRAFLFVLLLLSPSRGEVLAQSVSDSLLELLPQAADTQRVNLLADLAGSLAREDPPRALEFGELALEEGGALGHDRALAQAHYHQGLAYFSLGRFEESVEAHRQALEVLRETQDPEILGYVHNHLGNALFRVGEHPAAVAAFSQAIRRHEENADTAGWAYAHNNLGLLYWRTGRYDSALAHYRASLALRKATGDRTGIASLLNNMGVIHYQQGSYEAALDSYLRSLTLRQEEGETRGVALVLNNIGKTYQDWGQLNRARTSFRRGFAAAEESGDASALGYSLNNLGALWEEMGEVERAGESYRRSLQVYREAGLDEGVVLNLTSLGNLLREEARTDSALPVLEEAVALSQEAGNREQEARALAALGLTRIGTPGHPSATSTLEEALAISREIGQRRLSQEILGYLAAAREARGDYRSALRYQQAHMTLKDSLFNEASGRRIAAMQAAHHAEAREQENALLRSAREAQEAVIARQRAFFGLWTVLLVMAGTLAAVLFRAHRSGQRVNLLLSQSNAALQDKNEALKEALENVRTLKGLIPICAGCKKIRDDAGFWNEVESYVARHSEASFSHGLCPDCIAELYPELAEEKKESD